jgi:DNA-binding GntR family transcriptional regulator
MVRTRKIVSYLTLRERIADAIRDDIIKGRLKAGQRVSEPELAARYGISRTPVREAFRQLAAEGFLQLTPRKGVRIAFLTEKDVTEFYELKSVLEGYAARIAAEKIQEKDLQKMEQLNEQIAKLHEHGDLKKIAKVHGDFHNIFLEASGNDQLQSTVSQLASRFQRFTILLALAGKNMEAVAQHREIIDAFRKRDADRAEQLVKANAFLGKELMIKEVLRNMPR